MPRLSYIESFNMNVCLHSSLHMSETNAEKKQMAAKVQFCILIL